MVTVPFTDAASRWSARSPSLLHRGLRENALPTTPSADASSPAEGVIPAPRFSRSGPLLVAAGVFLLGIWAALYYSRIGLALAHYDARAHLVVARRILDSLVPGWQQIGAVWLPLPHVLNMLPVQVDPWYRSGASAIVLSIASMAVAGWALTRFTVATTGSVLAGAVGTALLMLNPNLLYLQSTPMTEPMLIGTCMVAVLYTTEWVRSGARSGGSAAGWAIVAACMTRYEAWPICAAAIGLALVALLRQGLPLAETVRTCARLAAYPAIALVLFSLNSRWTTGTWFVPAGFFVPENPALGNPALALEQVRESVLALSGPAWVWPAYGGLALVAVAVARQRDRAPLLLVLALTGAALVPWYAYYQGHPLRIRYGLPLVVASAAITAAGIGTLWKPLRVVAAMLVLGGVIGYSGAFDARAPMIAESQRDAANRIGRQVVTEYLRAHWDGATIMMSMGSLAHYMHDLTELDLDVRDFLQEGNEQLWVQAAARGPRGFVKWVAIEEQAEGGDALFQAARTDPRFLEGFVRVAAGGGVALYRAR